jgi:GNAT superfamily N-acetyltransferase
MTAVVVRMLGAGDVARFDAAAAGFLDGVDATVAAALVDDPSRHVAIAVDGGAIVGVAFAMLDGGRAGELVVADLVVAPSHRRRGIARRLLARLLEHARALGCVAASLEAERDDAAVRALCAAAGGVEVPEPRVRVAFALG